MNLELLSLDNRDTIITENKEFVYKMAQGICKRRLSWENDDELSIALIAFNHACDTFEYSKGNFYSYTGMVIRNALYDYFRKSKNSPLLFFQDEEEKLDYFDIKASLTDFEKKIDNKNRAEEIAAFSKELEEYMISFDSLVECSPSHIDTRNSLLNLAFTCAKDEFIINYIRNKKLLPIKEIISLTNVKRKFVEKWRKYIITLILVLSNENYLYIRSFLGIKVGDNVD